MHLALGEEDKRKYKNLLMEVMIIPISKLTIIQVNSMSCKARLNILTQNNRKNKIQIKTFS